MYPQTAEHQRDPRAPLYPAMEHPAGTSTDATDQSQTRWLGSDSILFATAHRPWPPPMSPWVMTQRWNDLLFLHYAVAPEILRLLIPEPLTLDTYDQRAWLSITPFVLDQLRPHGGLRLPVVSRFPELNVRTYVTYDGKPGVFFFSLDAGNLSAVWGARIFYRLPYWKASMKVKGRGSEKIEYSVKTRARSAAGGVSRDVSSARTAVSRRARLHSPFPNRTLLPVRFQSPTTLSREHPSFAVVITRGGVRD